MVVHRDLKPHNVMVGEFGETYVVDFGLAKVRGEAVTTLRTEAGEETSDCRIRGTPAYMPPEQIENPEGVDAASDQWALGAILYEILTLRPTYTGSEAQLWTKAVRCEVAPLAVSPGTAHGTSPVSAHRVSGDVEATRLPASAVGAPQARRPRVDTIREACGRPLQPTSRST